MVFLLHSRLKDSQGFTLNELCVVLAIIATLSAIAVPSYYQQIEGYRLRRAARDLYYQMQWSKIDAIKNNSITRIFFDSTPGQQGYEIWSAGPNKIWEDKDGDDILERQVVLSDYGPGISFGQGNATKAATKEGGAIPEDGISFDENNALFNSKGMAGKMGYVYFRNAKGDNFAIGTIYLTGFLVFKKWDVKAWH